MLAQIAHVQWFTLKLLLGFRRQVLAHQRRQRVKTWVKTGEVLAISQTTGGRKVQSQQEQGWQNSQQKEASLALFSLLYQRLRPLSTSSDELRTTGNAAFSADARDGLTPDPIVKRFGPISDSVPKPLLQNVIASRCAHHVASRRLLILRHFLRWLHHLMAYQHAGAISAWRLAIEHAAIRIGRAVAVVACSIIACVIGMWATHAVGTCLVIASVCGLRLTCAATRFADANIHFIKHQCRHRRITAERPESPGDNRASSPPEDTFASRRERSRTGV